MECHLGTLCGGGGWQSASHPRGTTVGFLIFLACLHQKYLQARRRTDSSRQRNTVQGAFRRTSHGVPADQTCRSPAPIPGNWRAARARRQQPGQSLFIRNNDQGGHVPGICRTGGRPARQQKLMPTAHCAEDGAGSLISDQTIATVRSRFCQTGRRWPLCGQRGRAERGRWAIRRGLGRHGPTLRIPPFRPDKQKSLPQGRLFCLILAETVSA